MLTNGAITFEHIFIAVSGPIAAGKSTLCGKIGKTTDSKVFEEPHEENVYLSDFYENPNEYAFRVQVNFLNMRYKLHKNILLKKGGVQDRSIYEDAVFASTLHKRGEMTERDLNTYKSLFENMMEEISHPDIFVYLRVSPEQCLDRIKKRGRDYEAGITLDYLKDLHGQYEEWVEEMSWKHCILRVNWENFGNTDTVISKVNDILQNARIPGITDLEL